MTVETELQSESEEVIVHLGMKIPLQRPLLSQTIINALRKGFYEKQEANELERLIEPDERILEIGAGIGFISSLCAKNENAGAIRAYEANPDLIPFIKRVHALNEIDKVEVVNGVLSSSPTSPKATFYQRHDFWASSLSPEPFKYKNTVEVDVVDFDAVIAEFKPTLIICDIEGGELDLMRHATLGSVKKVYMEIHQKVLGRRGIKDLFDCMSAKGFHYDQHHSHRGVVLFSHVDR